MGAGANGGRMTRREILRRALECWDQGRLYDRANTRLDHTFRGSIDRFCEIAFRLQDCRRILDVGCGTGLLVALLTELGHECHALDITDSSTVWRDKSIEFQVCNVEVDRFPYPDHYFDAATCCQVLEHFTYSHLPAIREMHRVLRSGGTVEIDVPNAVSFRNRSRLLRGKHITWDYKRHYLLARPVEYQGKWFFPGRHNREFTIEDVRVLLETAGFVDARVEYLRSRRYRQGWDKIRSLGTMLKDAIPSLRKSIIAFASKGPSETLS